MTGERQKALDALDKIEKFIGDGECLTRFGHEPICKSDVEIIRAVLTCKENAENFIKTPPHETYEGLRKQYAALRLLVNSQAQMLSHCQKREYASSEARLEALEESLESERAMNAQLTEEIEALTAPRITAEMLEWLRKDWSSCGCNPCDSHCRVRKEAAWDVIDELLEMIK